MEWKHELLLPGPNTPTTVGNFPVEIAALNNDSFFIVSGDPPLNIGDTIIITGTNLNGTFEITDLDAGRVFVTPDRGYEPGTFDAFIEVIRPVATWLNTEIEEPIGFNDIVFNIIRDDIWHGIMIQASSTTLGFYGESANIIRAEKESIGVDAIVLYRSSVRCEGETDFTEAIEGKLNFSSYQETCGSECIIRMNIESDNCAMTFKNRFDQKVNVDSLLAFDKTTGLADYEALGFTLELATQEIPISANAEVALAEDASSLTNVTLFLGEQNVLIRPIYERVNDNSILTGQLDDPTNTFQDPSETFSITPQVLLEENATCISEEFTYDIRLKGAVLIDVLSEEGPAGATLTLRTVVDIWDGNGTHVGPGNGTGDATPLHNDLVGTFSTLPKSFDASYQGTVTLPPGWGIYAYIKIYYSAGIDNNAVINLNYEFDSETKFVLENIKACPPTDSEAYMINETLARVTESITDRCLTVRSDYYGRTDSQPYSSDTDGCGSLRVLTPGLKIRQAEDKDFFASMKELLEGLRGIDNIGFGLEDRDIRIESVEYFYQDSKILDLDFIPEARSSIEEKLIYSNIKAGYNKWEIKSIKGIDEFNSYKERRTSIKAINNTLDITTNLIASGYIIENLRTQTLVNSGNTDNSYDNDIFIICVDRDAYGYHVEQGVIENASNIFSPATVYNWRIRPLYNVMRWFKSIAQAYVNLQNTASKIFFTSGKGNYTATGNISVYDNCGLDYTPLPENDDIDILDFKNIEDATPIYKPEIITFTYPLSVAEFHIVKNNLYGYFNVQCGTGSTFKAYIKNLAYKPAQGTAEFTLIKKWQ